MWPSKCLPVPNRKSVFVFLSLSCERGMPSAPKGPFFCCVFKNAAFQYYQRCLQSWEGVLYHMTLSLLLERPDRFHFWPTIGCSCSQCPVRRLVSSFLQVHPVALVLHDFGMGMQCGSHGYRKQCHASHIVAV